MHPFFWYNKKKKFCVNLYRFVCVCLLKKEETTFHETK